MNVKNNDHKVRKLLWISVEWARLSNSLCALLQNVCKFLLQIEVNTLSLSVCSVSRRPHWHPLYLHSPDLVGWISLFMLVYYNRSSKIYYNKSGFLCLVLEWRMDHHTGFAHNVRPVPKMPQTLYWFLGQGQKQPAEIQKCFISFFENGPLCVCHLSSHPCPHLHSVWGDFSPHPFFTLSLLCPYLLILGRCY